MDKTVAELWMRARQAYQAGSLPQCEQICRRILEAEPGKAEVWEMLGNLHVAQDRFQEAAASLEQALRLRPDQAQVHNNLGIVRARQGQPAKAAACFRQALALQSNYARAHNNLGAALSDQGKFAEAVACLREALRLEPNYTEARANLHKALASLTRAGVSPPGVLAESQAEGWNRAGIQLAQAGKPDEAQKLFRQAIELRPDFAEAHNNLGNTLAAQERREEAAVCYRQALAIKPDYANAWSNLGNILFALGDYEQAAANQKRALQLLTNFPEAHNNLGLALGKLGHGEQAATHYREAIRQRPDFAEAYDNLGRVLGDLERPEEACQCFEEALRLRPDLADAHWSLALTLLFLGDFARGWPGYEWRWRRPGAPKHPFRQPQWDGSPLQGRTIVLHAEQGLGDAIQFLRYVPLVKDRGGTVVVRCPLPLHALLRRLPGIDRLVDEHAPLPACDCQAPLLSLPFIFKTTLDSVPARVPYLVADPRRVARWQQELAGIRAFKVGIAWRGNPHHKRDSYRTIPLNCFAPLAALPSIQLVSLQKGAGSEQIASLDNQFSVLNLNDPNDTSAASFSDTAALMCNMDLVITADTGIAHLAGALAMPTWLAISTVPDWRWLRERQDSPWYPTMRLFRQKSLGDWDELFQRMASELNHRA